MHVLSFLTSSAIGDAKTAAAVAIFVGSYIVFALGRFPGLKIDRPGAAIIGAVLMVVAGVIHPSDTVKFIDFRTIILLFSMMLVVSNLRLSGFFDWSAGFFLRHLERPQLLPAVIFISGFLSAFFVNDIVCLAMVPLVLTITRRMGLRPERYLLAVATGSNIGSVATITGNPQNILIGTYSGIRFLDFLLHLGPIAFAGLLVDWGLLHWLYPRQDVPVAEAQKSLPALPGNEPQLIKGMIVATLIVVGFLCGFSPPAVAALGAALLLISRSIDPKKVYQNVDWGLLVFFIGLFIIVGGAQSAGIISRIFSLQKWLDLRNVAVLAAFTAILGNIVSNVPAVMLLRTVIPTLGNSHQLWLLLAMASTLAGNLTITGSVANIIVIETAGPSANIGFWKYARIGVPVTIITLIIGTLWVWRFA